MALQTISTRYFGKSALERAYTTGATVSSAPSGLTGYIATKPVDINPILGDSMLYDYKLFTPGTDTRPFQFWNSGMTHTNVVFDETHNWSEDTLYPIGEEVDTEALTNSLATGVEKGWITDDEAKAEYRAAFGTVRYADQAAKQRADRIENLKKALAEEEASAEAGK